MTDKIDEYNERRALERSRKIAIKKEMKSSTNLARKKIKEEGRCRNPRCTTGMKPEWHHAVPRSKFSQRDKTQNSVDNAIPVCHVCHMEWHQNITVLRRSDLQASEISFILRAIGEHWIDRHYPE